MNKRNLKRLAELGIVMTAVAALVVGCGGGSSSSSSNNGSATVALSGIVADGYLSGAKVCLDINSNGVCDSGEPSSTSGSNGDYTITGITSGQQTLYPVVAEVPSTAVDKDTGSAVGQAFTLAAPAGASFVSPLSTLVNEKVLAGAAPASAVAAVGQALGIPAASGVSVSDNYVSLKGSATDQTNGYFRAHEAAKTIVAVLKAGKASLGSSTGSTDKATQTALLGQAESVLQYQATSNVAAAGALFSHAAVNASSVVGAGSLKAQIAANNAGALAAAATQNVTINFDVINGATNIGVGGCTASSLTLGTASTVGSLKDLRFYVSGVALIDAAGNYSPVVMTENANQGSNVALLDFENGTGNCAAGTAGTYTAITGKVAPGNYVGIAFSVGVPGKLNHTNPADTVATPLPLQNSAMNWSWQSGRKFTKIEFTSAAAVTTMVHLGATGCKADPLVGDVLNGCGSPNRMQLSFASFDPATQKIALDLGALFNGLDLTTSKTWMSAKPGGMMMAGSAAYFFDKLQIDAVTGLPINDGAAQTLFVVQ